MRVGGAALQEFVAAQVAVVASDPVQLPEVLDARQIGGAEGAALIERLNPAATRLIAPICT